MSSTQLYADTGCHPIDSEHRALSAALERFVEVVNAGKADVVGTALESLIVDVAFHFSHEEALMKEFGYPQRVRHEEAHAIFVGDARHFQERLSKSGVEAAFRQWAVRRLPLWFRLHILVHDVGLGHFLSKSAFGSSNGRSDPGN